MRLLQFAALHVRAQALAHGFLSRVTRKMLIRIKVRRRRIGWGGRLQRPKPKVGSKRWISLN